MDGVGEKGKGRSGYAWWIPPLAAFVSGGLMAGCYYPLNFHWLAWFALVPWLVVAPRLDSGKIWLYGMVLGLVFYRLGFSWLCDISGPLGVFVILGLAIWMGLAFRAASLVAGGFSAVIFYWMVPLTFTAQEILRCEGLGRFRVGYLAYGYSQSHNLWISQIASVGGVYLVTFALLAVNASLAYVIVHRNRRGLLTLGAVVVIVFCCVWLSRPPVYADKTTVPVACVQAEEVVGDEFVRLAEKALDAEPAPEIVVFPEHTIYEIAGENNPQVIALSELARKNGAYICVGAHTPAVSGSSCPFDNSGVLIDPLGKIVAVQPKAVPVPLFSEEGNPAKSQEVTDTAYGKVGICVCYDATFTDIPRKLVDGGAELILVPVMDPRRWPEKQCRLHADMSSFRSIELRRCFVRAASSGVSQIVWADGSVKFSRTRDQGNGILAGNVFFEDARTIFVRGGYFGSIVVSWLYLLLLVVLTVTDWASRARSWGKVARS